MTNHNHTPVSTPELTAQEKNVLSINMIEAWRTRQFGMMHGLAESHGWDGSPSGTDYGYADSVDGSLEDFLHEQGIDADSPNYNQIKDVFRSATPGRDEAGFVSERAWHIRNDDGVSKRDEFVEHIHELNPNSHDYNTTEASDETSDIDIEALHGEALIDNARFDVNGARESWATVSAKRQGRAFGKTNGHDEVKDDYHAKVQKLGILELEGQISPDDDDTTKNAKVIAYLFEEQRRLRELTTEKLQGTKVGKFVAFMNKGSFGMRMLKGVGLGIAVGAGGSLLLGAAGAAGGAALAISASRFVKGYASNDRHRGMQTAQESFTDENGQNNIEFINDEAQTLDQKLKAVADVYNDDFDDDTRLEQSKRRKALAWGIGSVAVGAGVGHAISNLDTLQDTQAKFSNKISGWINGESDNGARDNNTQNSTDTPSNDADSDGVPNAQDLAPRDQSVGAIDYSEISEDARWIDSGEGGFQTLKELGVPEAKWEAVWADAGEHFNESDKTYMMADGRWGWNAPGRISNHDIFELVKAARRNGVELDYTLGA